MTTIPSWRVRRLAAAVALIALGAAGGYLWAGPGAPGPAVTLPATLAASTTGASAVPSTGITVTGTGTVRGTPDTLRLSMGVAVTGSSVDEALNGANGAASRVQASLRQHGVAATDLQTDGLSIQPQYTGPTSVISGYQVSESLSAALRDLRTAGAAITAAAQAGGNATRVDGVTLDLAGTGSLVSAARRAAFTEAHDKAEQYARAAGIRMGPALTISEAETQPPPVSYDVERSAAGAVPIATGSSEVAVSVTVSFAIGG